MDWIEIDEARNLLRAEAAVYGESQGRLATLLARLRPSPQETSDEDLGVYLDVPTEIRSVIAYALQEHLGPLIRNLLAAAEYQNFGTAD